jgi:hypothetical protein
MNARRITGFSLLLLAGLLIASLPLSVGMLDYDPRDRNEIGGFLTYIHEHETQYGARMALLLAKDAVVSVIVGAGLFLVFAGANRTLAALGAAGWLVATAGFLAIDGMEASMIAFADDYATVGVDQVTTLSVARSIAIVSGLTGQAAFSSFAVGLGSIGLLIVRHRGPDMPPAFLGWLGIFGAACWLLLWTSALTEAGFVFLPLGALSVIVWMLGVGFYLVRHSSTGATPASATA